VYPDTQFSAYYAFGGSSTNPPAAPSNLAATAISSSEIDLAWTDNSSDETGFEIERSLDGSSFAWLASVGANTASYPNTGLNPATTYYYRVAASNSAGNSAYSSTASATTQNQTPGTSLQVGSVAVTTVSAGKGLKYGQATVVVVDDQGNPVSGALVSGAFSGDITEQVIEAQTGATGSVTVTTSQSAKRISVLSFCVTSITHPALQNFSGSVCSSL